MSPEAILDYYDALSLPLIHKVIAFYLENQSPVCELISADHRLTEELQTRSSNGPSLAELRRRLNARQSAGAP